MNPFDRIIQLERKTGKRLVLRAVHDPNPQFRGRLTQRPLYYLLEYRDEEPGYFWHHGIIAELLDCLEQGRLNITLFEGDLQYQEVPLAQLLAYRKT